jgi:hypothetical protein
VCDAECAVERERAMLCPIPDTTELAEQHMINPGGVGWPLDAGALVPVIAERNKMYVIAIHAIDDPKTFWDAAQMLELPEGTTIHSVIPNEDGTRAVCLWESGSVATVEDIVEGAAGEVSTNEYFDVNEQNAIGLPAVPAAAG